MTVPVLTINAMPPDARLHALFLGYREGTYGFEVTGLGTLGIPESRLRRVGDLEGMMKGEDLNLKLDFDEGCVVVWRVK